MADGDASTTIGDHAHGVWRLSAFVDWLSSFMVYGSDQKVLTCGKLAFMAVDALMKTGKAGFRYFNGAHEYHTAQTPFGGVKIVIDASIPDGEIRATDAGIPDEPRIKSKAESVAKNVKTITF